MLREEDVAWHAPWRFLVAHHLVAALLAERAESEVRGLLWDQGEEFRALRFDFECSQDHPLLVGAPLPDSSVQGRGGGAVWRAERKLVLEAVVERLVKTGSADGPVTRPGWTLTTPAGWQPYSFSRAGGALPARQQSDLDLGRVLRLDHGRWSVLWPYNTKGLPVPNIGHVLAAGQGLSAGDLVELVLVTTEDLERQPRVPAWTACALGFIGSIERDALVADAQARNRGEIAGALRRAERLPVTEQAALRAAADDPERFARRARRARLRCPLVQPHWVWEVGSIAAVLSSATADQLAWLTLAMRDIRGFVLERDMEIASRDAFWLGETDPDCDIHR